MSAKTGGTNPIPRARSMGGEFVSDSSLCINERLFAWAFRVEVEAGLRRGDLLSTAPATSGLMKDGLIGSLQKLKPV